MTTTELKMPERLHGIQDELNYQLKRISKKYGFISPAMIKRLDYSKGKITVHAIFQKIK